MDSLRDIGLMAGFEVLRAIRTWRAMALFLLYAVATGGATWLFIQLIGLMENSLARNLGVPATQKPGGMLADLTASDEFRTMLEAMTGAPQLIEQLLTVPILAIFHLWFSFLLLPFFAASSSAESIAIDLQSRALRFEALRAGRIEIVLGRFVGQLLLTAGATAVAALTVWITGMAAMRGNPPLLLGGWLGVFSLRAWFYSIPFVGIGLAASQLTASPAWARVMAVSGTALTWIAWAIGRGIQAHPRTGGWEPVAGAALQALPQGWLPLLWQPGGWMVAALICAAMGPLLVGLGYAGFHRRDL